MKPAIVALVGRPNVGKSAIFNRLTGKGRAIVEATPGLTRDRNYGIAVWQNHEFIIVDTGGVELETHDQIRRQVQEQTQLALQEADVVMYVVDGRTPLDRADQKICDQLRKSAKPVLLVVNKMTTRKWTPRRMNFGPWAWGNPTRFQPYMGGAWMKCWTPCCSTCPSIRPPRKAWRI